MEKQGLRYSQYLGNENEKKTVFNNYYNRAFIVNGTFRQVDCTIKGVNEKKPIW